MKNNDKDFLKKIQSEIEKDAPALPENLSAENISELVKDEKLNKKSHRTAKRIAAAAACAVILFAAGAVGIKLYRPEVLPVAPPPQESDAEIYTSEYTEIKKFFRSLREKERVYSYAQNFNAFSSDKKGDAAESANGAASGAGTNTSDITTDESASIAYSSDAAYAQTQNVLEADIIKNDGRYLYIVHGEDPSKIVIVDTKDPKNLKVTAKISLPETGDETFSAQEIFLKDNKLIVLAGAYLKEEERPSIVTRNGITEVYDIGCYVRTESKSAVFIYDLSRISKPQKVAEYSLDGCHISSRLTGNTLLIASNYSVPLYKDNKELDEACIPSYYVNSTQYKIPEKQIHILPENEENSYTVIMKIDLGDEKAQPQTCAVLGGASDLYCSQTDIYVARISYKDSGSDFKRFTQIYRFSFEKGLEYKATVKLSGSTLNQFSMDEYNGFFRIATSDDNKQSYITVLDKELNVIGKLEGIAKGESIYAVRFMENKAYVVTFYQTDPLFVIDLSNPVSPRIEGELKIPGFSNMLFPYSDTLLIGIGQDGTENGANNKLKVSLFDISDKSNPKEISKAVSSTGAHSSAAYNHKAFMQFSDTGEFAIPIYSFDDYGNDESFLCTFKVENNSLSVSKKYEITEENAGSYFRGAYTGNTVFVISDNSLYAFDRNSQEIISKISLLDKSEISNFDIVVYN